MIDRKHIFAVVRQQPAGFTGLNSVVFAGLRKWMDDVLVLKVQMQNETINALSRLQSNHAYGVFLSAHGDYDRAAELLKWCCKTSAEVLLRLEHSEITILVASMMDSLALQ